MPPLRLLALRALVWLGGRVPTRALDVAAVILGTLAWYAAPRLRAVTRDHMRHVLGPGTPSARIDAAARGCVRATARYYADFAAGPHRGTARPFERAEGLMHITDAAARGRGVILLSAHLGSPESIGRTLVELGIDLLVLTEPLQPQAVDDFVRAVREATTPGARFVTADLAGVRLAIEHLRRGGVVAALGDRDVLGNGVSQLFFGERARLPAGVADLALRSGAEVVPGFALRTPGGGIRAVVEPPLHLPHTNDPNADREEARRLVLTALERGIRLAPDQWFPLQPVWSGLGGGVEREAHRS